MLVSKCHGPTTRSLNREIERFNAFTLLAPRSEVLDITVRSLNKVNIIIIKQYNNI